MRLSPPAAVLLFAATVSAQAFLPPRGKALGFVGDADGAPVADAEVVLWSWPLPERLDVGAPDRVVVRTGASGRFSAEILDGRSHSAYASWQDARGRHVTALAMDVLPGAPCLLREAAARARATIAVRGGAGFRQRGPLRVALVVGRSNPLVLPLALDRDEQAALPAALPAGPTWIDVRAADGQLLRSEALADDPPDARQTIAVPDSHTTVLAVEDAAGQPLAGADVYVMHDFGYHGVATARRVFAPDRLGRTGADGTLRVALPASHPVEGPSQTRAVLLVAASHHQRHTVDVVLTKTSDGARTTARLRAGVDVRARFVGRDGAPMAAGIVPLYESDAQTDSTHPLGGFVPLPPLPMVPAADGAFAGFGLHGTKGVRVFAIVDPAVLAAVGVPLHKDFGVPPLVPIVMATTAAGAADLDLGDVHLDRFALARFAVVDQHGAPIAASRLRLHDDGGFPTPIDFLSDRVGRLQVPLPPGTYRVGAFVHGGGVAAMRLTVPDDVPTDGRLELRLSEPRVLRGVVDAGGRALPPDTRVVFAHVEDAPADLAALAHPAAAVEPIAADGSFRVRVPFGNARWVLRVACGSGSTQTAGELVGVQVGQDDVAEIALPVPR